MIFNDIYGRGKRLVRADRIFYFFAFLLLLSALGLETLPTSAIAVVFTPHGAREYIYSSYFSTLLMQYGNSYPFACGIMTVLIVIASALCLTDNLRSLKLMYSTLASNILALLFALLPLLVFGRDCVTSLGAGVLSCLLASMILQAAVLVYENYVRHKK